MRLQPTGENPTFVGGFALYSVNDLPRIDVAPSPAIRRLGAKAIQYHEALLKSSRAGHDACGVALSAFQECVELTYMDTVTGSREALLMNSSVLVNLELNARWKLDTAGIYALQTLAFSWNWLRTEWDSKRTFNLESFDFWWPLCRDLLTRTYKHPEQVPQLAALATAPTYQGSAPLVRNQIMRRFKDRLWSFAPPLPESAD